MRSVKVGLVLGAGASRGLSHIGVLQVLEQEGIPVDMITGCSIGSIIGAIYGCGAPLDSLEKLIYQLDERMIYDLSLPRKGLIKGQKLETIIRTLTKNMSFEQARLPMAFVACDVERGTLEVFNSGNICRAVRASISIPGIFEPVEIDGKWYVDGSTIDRLPVGTMRAMGPDMIIAVDVGYRGQYHAVKNIYEIILAAADISQWDSIQHRARTHPEDVLIIPEVSHIRTLSLSQAEECIELGREGARKAMPKIQERMAAIQVELDAMEVNAS